MHGLSVVVIGILQITLLDLVLSGDNVGVIALATRNLPEKYAKKASIIGVVAAVTLRIIFACLVTYILKIAWLPIRLIGGLLLVKVTWDLIRPSSSEEDANVKSQDKFWGAVWSIVIADVSMSLDNVLAIAAAANGNLIMIIFGIALNIPIIFFGSRIVAEIMKKYAIVIYIGGAVLAHTAVKMILEDRLINQFINEFIANLGSIMAAMLVIIYGIYLVYIKQKRN